MRDGTLSGVALNDDLGDHGTRDALGDHGTTGGCGTRSRKTLYDGEPQSQKHDVQKKDETTLYDDPKNRTRCATTTPSAVSYEKQPRLPCEQPPRHAAAAASCAPRPAAPRAPSTHRVGSARGSRGGGCSASPRGASAGAPTPS